MGKAQFFLDTMWPPTLGQVKTYFLSKGMIEQEAIHFFAFYQLKQWRTCSGEMIKKWKPAAFGWIFFAARQNITPVKNLN